MSKVFKRLSPARIIALGFFVTIFVGAILLSLPISIKDGQSVSFIDALYTSTSAVCVTGLIVVDAGTHFTAFGQTVLALLIQAGGLGITAIGTGIILLISKRINLKERAVVKESLNLTSAKGIAKFLKSIFLTTLIFELAGAIICFPVFLKDFSPLHAAGISLFHSIASFNNAGFDILGQGTNLIPYQDSVIINITTALLIIFGGIGFLVIHELRKNLFNPKKLSMHAKVVLCCSIALIVIGTLFIKATEEISWLGAFFHSVSARTAGFSTYNLGDFSEAGRVIMMILMVIGASPGSTGGGIKTTTLFALIQGVKKAATNLPEKAFKYSMPKESFKKASVVTVMALAIILAGIYIMSILEPNIPLSDISFEITSAFGTVGLSTGISPNLSVASKILTIIIMYIGRLGTLTVATIWTYSDDIRVRYPEGNITVG